MAERRAAAKKAREEFGAMLEECKDLKLGMRFSKAAAILEDDPRFKVFYLTCQYTCSCMQPLVTFLP